MVPANTYPNQRVSRNSKGEFGVILKARDFKSEIGISRDVAWGTYGNFTEQHIASQCSSQEVFLYCSPTTYHILVHFCTIMMLPFERCTTIYFFCESNNVLY